jgi:hypothetical protein
MVAKKMNSYKKYLIFFLFFFLLLTIFYGLNQSEAQKDNFFDNQVTLISKSDGLENPTKEEGKTELEIADMNNDGHVDIISVGDHGSPYINSDEHGIMVWLGDGEGVWTVKQDGNFGYGGCAVGDINKDGFMDVAWGIHHDYGSSCFGDSLIGAALGDGSANNWIPWAAGLGTNGETWGMFATDMADFNCDGYLDIVSQSFGCCNGLHVYENHGNGTWSPVWSLTGGNVKYTLETCDINADGLLDFVATKDGSIVFLNNGSFTFHNHDNGLPVHNINSIDAGDMNNDGYDDIVVSLSSTGVRCYVYDIINDTWVSYSNGLPTLNSYYLSQFGDIDGDGFLDIVCYKDPTGYVYLGDGSGNWLSDATFTMPSPGDYSAMRVDGDIDHDGREDIAIQAEKSDFPTSENQLRVYSPWLEPTSLSSRIKKPNGGESFKLGSIRDITWLASIPPSHFQVSVDIELSTTGLSGPWQTIASDIANNGRYQWTVSGVQSTNCRIKIIITSNQGSCESISSFNFTITQGIGNTPPDKPNRPIGPIRGFTNTNYTFLTSSTDSENDNITYGWDWNDDTVVDNWTGYVLSGITVEANNSWNDSGIYYIKVVAEDEHGLQSSLSEPWPIMIDINNSCIPFLIGWNLITIPDENNWFASDLANNITNCLSVSGWNASLQTYETYIPGVPPSDFKIQDGCGYFVDVNQTSLLDVNGSNISDFNVSLLIGWNLIGWYHEYNTTASSIAENITGCLSVSCWNASVQTYDTYIAGVLPSDFVIGRGMGLFVDVDKSSYWYGQG